MSRSTEFRREKSLVFPLGEHFATAGAGVGVFASVVLLLLGQWVWAAFGLCFAVLGWAERRWYRQTPLIKAEAGELVIRRHPLSSRRLRLDTIAALDDSRPGKARLVLQGGQAVTIPLQLMVWDDRAPFLTYLRSVVGGSAP